MACAAFEEYGDVTKTVPLDFTEDDVMWVASKLSSAAGTLGAEAMELRNWLLRSDVRLRSLESSLPAWQTGWLTPPPWAAYCALMACRLVALDKRPGVRPVGIGKTL